MKTKKESTIHSDFDIWKTMRLGTEDLRTPDDFTKACRNRPNIGIYPGVRNELYGMMSHPDFLADLDFGEVDLVKVSIKDLLPNVTHARYLEFCDTAFELGLKLCVPETAFRVRLEYLEQSNADELQVATHPILNRIFGLSSSSAMQRGLQIYPVEIKPFLLSASHEFVFTKPRK